MEVTYDIETALNEKKVLTVSYPVYIKKIMTGSCINIGGVSLGAVFEFLPYNSAAEIRSALYPMQGCSLSIPSINRRMYAWVIGAN